MVQMKQCATVQLAQIPNIDLQNAGKSRVMSNVPAATQAPILEESMLMSILLDSLTREESILLTCRLDGEPTFLGM